jgi:hypothetical protein
VVIGPGVTVPCPFEVIVTFVAFTNVDPEMVTGVDTHVMPDSDERVSVGGLAQPQATVKVLPVVEQPLAFMTVMLWLPFVTPLKVALLWKVPELSRLYWYPLPVGDVTVITAFPAPREQSADDTGDAGAVGAAGITAFAEGADEQPAEFITVKLYVPGARPVIVVDAEKPETPVELPCHVICHPAVDSPPRRTLPVDTEQVGAVMVVMVGVAGTAFTVMDVFA